MKLRTLFAFAPLAFSSHAAELRTIHSQPSWVIATQQMEVAVTKTGAMMAPVSFFRDFEKPVRPCHISPWQDEGLNLDVPVLVALRGDWFCMPFGGNANAFHGEQHPPHGELAGSKWSHVETKTKRAPDADVTRLPSRQGFADLLQIYYQTGEIAWLTVTRPDEGWLWFSLKDPAVLNSTVFWIENHGRHGVPWNGRNNCLGLEDVTAFFAEGLATSARPNLLTKQGIKTAIELTADHPTAIRHIQGVAKVPPGFEQVKTLEFTPDRVTFVSVNGLRVGPAVRHEFLKTGHL